MGVVHDSGVGDGVVHDSRRGVYMIAGGGGCT